MPYKVQKKGDQHCVVVSAGPKKGKEVACHATREKAVAQVKALYANDAAVYQEQREEAYDLHNIVPLYDCYEPECGRLFSVADHMFDHAEAVHTFEDIRRLVNEAVREKHGKAGSYQASPPIPSIWVWVDDLADDWVVYMVEEGVDSTLYKAAYSITDNNVTLGEPTEVRRRTVYDPVKASGGN